MIGALPMEESCKPAAKATKSLLPAQFPAHGKVFEAASNSERVGTACVDESLASSSTSTTQYARNTFPPSTSAAMTSPKPSIRHAFLSVLETPSDSSEIMVSVEGNSPAAFSQQKKCPQSEASGVSALPMNAASDHGDGAVSLTKPVKKKKRSRSCVGSTSGRWTMAEHSAFLQGLATYGREWKRVAADIPSRTSAQVRSHAQKYFAKLAKQDEDEAFQQLQQPEIEPPAAHEMSDSVRRHAARILADPDSVEEEVKNTLQQLRVRYRQLQERMQMQVHECNESAASSVEEDELIALRVLQGGLQANDTKK